MNANEKRYLAEVLARKYTSEFGARNPDWDWQKPDGPDNPYYFERPMDERVMQSPYVIFQDPDGYNAISHPSITEIVEELDEAIEQVMWARDAEEKN